MFWVVLFGGLAIGLTICMINAHVENHKENVANKEAARNNLQEIRERHPNAQVFVASYSSGFVIFSDDEQIMYCGWNSALDEHQYDRVFSSKVEDFCGAPFTDHDRTRIENRLSVLKKQNDERVEEERRQREQEYIKKIQLPEAHSEVYDIRPDGRIEGGYYVWTADNCLHIASVYTSSDPNDKVIAPKRNIMGLSQSGGVHYTTNVSGGGGGGSSMAGAAVGGLLAGEAGAIIGSRKEIEKITTTTEKIDDRQTHLSIVDDNNKLLQFQFRYDDYYVLKKLIDSLE